MIGKNRRPKRSTEYCACENCPRALNLTPIGQSGAVDRELRRSASEHRPQGQAVVPKPHRSPRPSQFQGHAKITSQSCKSADYLILSTTPLLPTPLDLDIGATYHSVIQMVGSSRNGNTELLGLDIWEFRIFSVAHQDHLRRQDRLSGCGAPFGDPPPPTPPAHQADAWQPPTLVPTHRRDVAWMCISQKSEFIRIWRFSER